MNVYSGISIGGVRKRWEEVPGEKVHGGGGRNERGCSDYVGLSSLALFC